MEEKQYRFLFGVIALLGVGGTLIYFLNQPHEITLKEMAEARATELARDLIKNNFEQKVFLPDESLNKGRSLASVEIIEMTKKSLEGEVGFDPWGLPFYYTVKGDGRPGSTVFVWSVGENGKPDFRTPEELTTSGARGDDILVKVAF